LAGQNLEGICYLPSGIVLDFPLEFLLILRMKKKNKLFFVLAMHWCWYILKKLFIAVSVYLPDIHHYSPTLQ